MNYTAYHHSLDGRRLNVKFRQNDPPMKVNKYGALRPTYKLWTTNTACWDIVSGLKISHQPYNMASWESLKIDDKPSSNKIMHPTQFFLTLNKIHKFSGVNCEGFFDDIVETAMDDVPVVFAFIYEDVYIISTKKYESYCEYSRTLTDTGLNVFSENNVDYIVYWRQEDADYLNQNKIDIPMLDFSLLSHLLLGGFQKLEDHANILQEVLLKSERRKFREWEECVHKQDIPKPEGYKRDRNGLINIGTADQATLMTFILENFFYRNYKTIMNLCLDSKANIDELANNDIGEKMLQTIFPLFTVLPQYDYTHVNGPSFGDITVVKASKINMFRLASLFVKNRRGDFNIAQVDKFSKYLNHYILSSVIVDIPKFPVGTDEYIANGIFFSRNSYLGHYETFDDKTCDGIVIGKNTHIALTSDFSITNMDYNLSKHVHVMLLLRYIFEGSNSSKDFSYNSILSIFDVDRKDLDAECF